MIKRIVRLQFQEDKLNEFLAVFESTKTAIRAFEGCQHLELWQSVTDQTICFTYSYWRDEAALENYRQSPLFKATWQKTKPLFAARAQAWSVKMLDIVRPAPIDP